MAEDWDEQVADLHYADAPEYATGHGVSAAYAAGSSFSSRMSRSTGLLLPG